MQWPVGTLPTWFMRPATRKLLISTVHRLRNTVNLGSLVSQTNHGKSVWVTCCELTLQPQKNKFEPKASPKLEPNIDVNCTYWASR